GTRACNEVQLRQLLLLGARRYQRYAPIELIDDFENRLLVLFRWEVREQQPSDAEMRCCALGLWNQGIGGFLNAVMEEPIGSLGMENEFGSQRFVQITAQFFVRSLVHDGESGKLCAVTQTRELLQNPLSAER